MKNSVLIFLHGFLGSGEDWIPVMKACSTSVRCISVTLPGHGGSRIESHANKESGQEPRMSVEVIADILAKLIHNITSSRVVLVGYSMGARIALCMALRCDNLDLRVRRRGIAQDDTSTVSQSPWAAAFSEYLVFRGTVEWQLLALAYGIALVRHHVARNFDVIRIAVLS
ncbi:hypothetical protein IFM89_018603 [Coptis chinensis]|uniref:AB hydrolase-1 domain-containing protein n=1 Tax=Coptis chinensis TaxID=261450 RepID=A0A835HFY5_9MAGN|nr:hypothetical protein IFM89_018603 [Coptis chinensis]